MKKDIFNITVPINSDGYRIDKFLQSQINDLSRTRLQSLIRDGQVKINNIITKNTSKKIKAIDQIKVSEIKIDKQKELNKLIQLETNKQLNQFSRIYFNKSKINYSINEN